MAFAVNVQASNPSPFTNMTTKPRIIQSLAMVLLLTQACTSLGPYRGLHENETVMDHVEKVRNGLGEYVPNPSAKASDSKAHELDNKREHECLEKYNGRNPFWLGHVELKDYGSYQDHHQLDVVERAIESDLRQGGAMFKKGVTIVVFVHGWHNSSQEQSNDLRDFRDLLADLSGDERKYERGVLGVFVGWRGETLAVPGVNVLTYWSRKRAAETIGRGSMVELMARIKNLEWLVARNGQRGTDPNPNLFTNCRLVMVGHSFGGTALYWAVGPGLKARFHEPYWDFRRYGNASETADRSMPLVTGYGDLILLINPAMEALPFRDLYYAMKSNATVEYATNQPVLMMVLSAENDWPNRVFLPVGQVLGNRGKDLFASTHDCKEAEQAITALGHETGFRTHNLKVVTNRLELTRNTNFFSYIDHDEDGNKFWKPIIPLRIKMNLESTGGNKGILTPDPEGPGLLPFMVVSVDKTIINGHGGFWPSGKNAYAYGFLRTFIGAQNQAAIGAREKAATSGTQMRSIR